MGSARLSRRGLLGAAGSLLLIAATGCTQTQSPGASPTQSPPDKKTSPVPSSKPSTADRVIKHAMGETKVPAEPQRVVVLDTGELDSALALGVKPVGAVTWFQDGDFQAYLKPMTEGIMRVGTIGQPNLEAVAALTPDLILSSKLRHENIYDKLAQIAPTVFTERVGVVWKENLKLHAEALGKTADAGQLMADYDGRLKDFKAKLGDQVGKLTVSIVRSYPDHIRLYQKGSFIGTILEDAGLARPASQGDPNSTHQKATRERMPDMDGDVIFVLHAQPDKGSQIKDLMSDPLWAQLRAVKAGKVYEVPDDTWALGIGILAANAVIDDLFKYLIK